MSLERMPAVAGQFYTDNAPLLRKQVDGFLAKADREGAPGHTILAMSPHAGYVYSGTVAGKTLGRANLARRVLLMGPKHTPYGQPLAVWPSGAWRFPGGQLAVDQELARAVLDADPRLREDTQAHLQEHSLEVLIPFLHAIDPGMRIVPLAVGLSDPDVLVDLGRNIGRAIKAFPEPVSMVVSSDMSHHIPEERARELDAQALEAALTLDPYRFYETVRSQRITMCGVLPMTVALAAAVELGAGEAEITAYGSSADASGDRSAVVGYAGFLVS